MAQIPSPQSFLPTSGGTLTGGLTISSGGLVLTAGNLTLNLGNVAVPLGSMTANGPVDVSGAGQGLQVKEGANAKQGRPAALTAGAVTVANTSVTAASEIFLTGQVLGGTAGGLNVSARTAGTSFTITSTNAADTSTAAFLMNEPG